MKVIDYLFVTIFSTLHANNLGSSINLFISMLNVFCLEDGVIFDSSWLINSSVEGTGSGLMAGFSIGLTEQILGFNACDVTTISYIRAMINKLLAYLGYVSWLRLWAVQPPHRVLLSYVPCSQASSVLRFDRTSLFFFLNKKL